MASSTAVVAKRYAKALWLMADGKSEAVRSWVGPLESLAASIASSKELRELVQSPAFKKEERWAVISKLAESVKAPEALTRFLSTLLSAGRLAALPAIAQALKEHLMTQENTVEATVESAVPLNEASTKQIAAMVEKMVGKKVILGTVLRPELLAGIRIQVMGKTLDASLASSIESMNKQLLKEEAAPTAMAQA